jgi:hypothetical protein
MNFPAKSRHSYLSIFIAMHAKLLVPAAGRAIQSGAPGEFSARTSRFVQNIGACVVFAPLYALFDIYQPNRGT